MDRAAARAARRAVERDQAAPDGALEVRQRRREHDVHSLVEVLSVPGRRRREANCATFFATELIGQNAGFRDVTLPDGSTVATGKMFHQRWSRADMGWPSLCGAPRELPQCRAPLHLRRE